MTKIECVRHDQIPNIQDQRQALIQASFSLCQFMSGGHSEMVPRLPIPNRTVKHLSADDSVAFAM